MWNGLREGTLATVSRDLVHDGTSTGRLTKDCHSVGVSAKLRNIGLNPFQGESLVVQASISCSVGAILLAILNCPKDKLSAQKVPALAKLRKASHCLAAVPTSKLARKEKGFSGRILGKQATVDPALEDVDSGLVFKDAASRIAGGDLSAIKTLLTAIAVLKRGLCAYGEKADAGNRFLLRAIGKESVKEILRRVLDVKGPQGKLETQNYVSFKISYNHLEPGGKRSLQI